MSFADRQKALSPKYWGLSLKYGTDAEVLAADAEVRPLSIRVKSVPKYEP
jgi:hypothetical protein